MNELELLIGKVARQSFFVGFLCGAAFIGIAVIIGLIF